MKLILAILLIILCISAQAQKPAKSLTITYIHREGSITELRARSGYKWYRADCRNLPDIVRLGTIIVATYSKRDTCQCLFKRYK